MLFSEGIEELVYCACGINSNYLDDSYDIFECRLF